MRKTRNIRNIIITISVLAIIGSIAYYWISQAPKRAFEKQIIAMQGMPINLNFEKAQGFIFGKDSVYTSNTKRKYVMFVDSIHCSECFLNQLENYFPLNDSIQLVNGEMIVILQPSKSNMGKLCHRIEREEYPFWCILDSEREFNHKNSKIPKNHKLHSFGLDENNNIILIGDPTKNQRINDLYIREFLK